MLLAGEQYAQASFWARQAAEKGMKADWILLDRDPWGHSVTRLITGLPEPERQFFIALRDAALYLDKLYILTRYPDALADLIPSEAFTREEAEEARDHAAGILDQVGLWLEQQGL